MRAKKLDPAPADPRLARLADWLGVAIDGQSRRGVTKQQIAGDHGTHGSNLSAFVTSKGRVRNVKVVTVEAILLDLGLHRNGVLTHGIHRWDLLDSKDIASGLGDLLKTNSDPGAEEHQQPHLLQLPVEVPSIAFVLLRPSPDTILLARVNGTDAAAIEESLGRSLIRRSLDVPDTSELQSCFLLQEHEWLIPRSITRIMNWPLQA